MYKRPLPSPNNKDSLSGATVQHETLSPTCSDSTGSRRLERDQKFTFPSVDDVTRPDYNNNSLKMKRKDDRRARSVREKGDIDFLSPHSSVFFFTYASFK